MIVAGFGFRKGAGPDSLADALQRAAPPQPPQRFATLAGKVPGLKAFARQQGADLIAVNADDAAAQATLTHSLASVEETGVPSVAEASALAAAGSGARLLGPRVVSHDRMATCALAVAEEAP